MGTERCLKVPLRGTFKHLSGFHGSAKRCNLQQLPQNADLKSSKLRKYY